MQTIVPVIVNRNTAPKTLLQTAVHFMSNNWTKWKSMGASESLLKIIQNVVIPVNSSVTFPDPVQMPLPEREHAFFKDLVQQWNDAGAVELAKSIRARHQFFLISKKGKSPFRPIADLRPVNPYVELTMFKMEGIPFILSMISPGDFMFAADLSSGYFQLRIHPISRSLLVFTFDGEDLQYTVLPFGYCLAPWIFTKIMRVLISFMCHSLHLRCSAYIDDIFGAVQGKDKARTVMEEAFSVIDQVTVRDSDKCSIEPIQEIVILGMLIKSVTMTIHIPDNKLVELLSMTRNLLDQFKRELTVSPRQIAKLAGRVCAYTEAFMPAQVFLQALHMATSIMLRGKKLQKKND
jgi:hypothetical protein